MRLSIKEAFNSVFVLVDSFSHKIVECLVKHNFNMGSKRPFMFNNELSYYVLGEHYK